MQSESLDGVAELSNLIGSSLKHYSINRKHLQYVLSFHLVT